MSNWTIWLAICGVVVVMELFTGTFYLLMFAIGLAGGAVAALAGLSLGGQLLSAAVVGSVATLSLRRSRFGARNRVDASRDPNVNLDIGQTIQVGAWDSSTAGTHNARAMYRGAMWDILCHAKTAPHAGQFRIVEIRGSQLIVEPESHHPTQAN